MVMLDFICIGSAELLGTGNKRKIQNESMSSAGIESATPRFLAGRLNHLHLATGTDVLLRLKLFQKINRGQSNVSN